MAVIGTLATEHYADGVVLTEHDLVTANPATPLKSSFFTVPPRSISDTDQHDVLEIWYIARGALTVHLDEDTRELTEDQAIFFAPQQVHRAENTGDCESTVVSLWWPDGGNGRLRHGHGARHPGLDRTSACAKAARWARVLRRIHFAILSAVNVIGMFRARLAPSHRPD